MITKAYSFVNTQQDSIIGSFFSGSRSVRRGFGVSQGILRLNPSWNTRAFTYHPLLRYGIAVIAVNIATIVNLLLVLAWGAEIPFLLFLSAVILSAWFGGIRAGLFATLLSIVMAYYLYFIASNSSLTVNPHFLIRSLVFGIEGFLVSGVLYTMHDAIKKYTLKNHELRKSEERYRMVVETVKDYAIYTVNSNGYITSWNDGAATMSGYSSQEVLGRHFSLFFPLDEIDKGSPWLMLRQAMTDARSEIECYQVTRGGRAFWANMVITSMQEANSLYEFSIIVRDMTERKEQEKRKDEFITIASHELKTPVTSLKVFTQVLLRQYAQSVDKNAIKYLHKMDIQLDRLTHLVNDLLDVSKIQAGNIDLDIEDFDMNELVRDTIDSLQGLSAHHHFVIRGNVLTRIKGDKDRIGQVLINFLTNAVKYSPNADEVVVSLSQDGEKVIISVKDFGIGIPNEYKNRIFERFFRVKHSDNNQFPGLGMGLFISSEIIRRHNGAFWVESEKDRGSTFYFTLPIQYE